MKLSVKKWLVGCTVAAAIGLFLNSSLMSEEHKVKAKPKSVAENSAIDHNDAHTDQLLPESVTATGNNIMIVSKTLKPPHKDGFVQFLPTGHYVDIWGDTGMTTVARGILNAAKGENNPDRINFRATFPNNVRAFPLAGEGNFSGSGGCAAHWSVEVAKSKIAGALILTDTNGGFSVMDTAAGGPAPPDTLSCNIADDDNKGDIKFWLNVESGTYTWDISPDPNPDVAGDESGVWKSKPYKQTISNVKPGIYTLTVTKAGFERKINFVVYGINITAIDKQFAPSIERLNIKYSFIKPDNLTIVAAKLEIFKKGDTTTPIYSDNSIPKTGTDVVYKQGETAGWNGKTTDDKWVTPADSEYTVKITASMKADFSNPVFNAKSTEVLVKSLEVSSAGDVIMNNPIYQEVVVVMVKLKKKDGTGAVTAVPIPVHFSFSDPGIKNTTKAKSYKYQAGKFLGKKDDDDAIYWADSSFAESSSTDGYKHVCCGKTVTAAGPYQGATIVHFKPSGVGGDDYRLRAAVKHTDKSELKIVWSDTVTVWRRVTFGKIHEMTGETHVSTNATVAKIQPYFDLAHVEYVVGVRKDIPAVKYIGLWENAAPHQRNWVNEQAQKAGVNHRILFGPHACETVATEIPTPAELAAAAGPAGDARDTARKAITKKAQAWTERIMTNYGTSLGQWQTNGGVTANSFAAIQYYHPKYSNGCGDTATDKWPAWVKVKTAFEGKDRDPDGMWDEGVAGMTHDPSGIISIPKGRTADAVKKTIAHEVGHATKNFFERQEFGPGDHSAKPGLMDPTGSEGDFSDKESGILRGKTSE